MGRTAIRGTASVLDATIKRVAYLFDSYDNIQLSFSAGKDSTVLFHLINEEAKRRRRKFVVYFQDQEALLHGTGQVYAFVLPYWRCFHVPVYFPLPVSRNGMPG